MNQKIDSSGVARKAAKKYNIGACSIGLRRYHVQTPQSEFESRFEWPFDCWPGGLRLEPALEFAIKYILSSTSLSVILSRWGYTNADRAPNATGSAAAMYEKSPRRTKTSTYCVRIKMPG